MNEDLQKVVDLSKLAAERAEAQVQLVAQLLEDNRDVSAVYATVAAEMIRSAAYYLSDDDDVVTEEMMGLTLKAVFAMLGGRAVIKAFKTMGMEVRS